MLSVLRRAKPESVTAVALMAPTPSRTPGLERAIKLVENTVKTYDPAAVNEALLERRAAMSKLFGIEKDARAIVQRQINALDRQAKIAERYFKYGEKYLPLSLEPFTWRSPKDPRIPQLVPFDIDNDLFQIIVKGAWHFRDIPRITHSITPVLPQGLVACYSDVLKAFADGFGFAQHERGSRTNIDRTANISARFTGVIPPDVREKIVEAQKTEHFQKIFILAEPEMTVSESEVKTPVPIPPDPIVFGWDGELPWHIAHFDLTPVEEAAILVGPTNPSN